MIRIQKTQVVEIESGPEIGLKGLHVFRLHKVSVEVVNQDAADSTGELSYQAFSENNVTLTAVSNKKEVELRVEFLVKTKILELILCHGPVRSKGEDAS